MNTSTCYGLLMTSSTYRLTDAFGAGRLVACWHINPEQPKRSPG